MKEQDEDLKVLDDENRDSKPIPRLGMPVSAYLSHIAVREMLRLWFIWIIPILCVAFGLSYDWRMLLVGLMVIFLIIPAIMAFAIIVAMGQHFILINSKVDEIELCANGIRLIGCNGEELRFIADTEISCVRLRKDNLMIETNSKSPRGNRRYDILLLRCTALGQDRINYIIEHYSKEKIFY